MGGSPALKSKQKLCEVWLEGALEKVTKN